MHGLLQAKLLRLLQRASGLDPVVKGLLWTSAGGLCLSVLNAVMRGMTLQLDPLQAQFLRYGCGWVVMRPLVLRAGLRLTCPRRLAVSFCAARCTQRGCVFGL